MSPRTLVAIAVGAALALTICADATPADPAPTPTTEVHAPATEPFADWTGSLEEAKALLAEVPGGDEISVITADFAPSSGQQRTRAARVFWDVPSVIVVTESWVNSLYGPGAREVLRSVMLHEYTHVIALTALSEGGSLPEELELTESDRQWAGGAMAQTHSGQSASLEAIASCVQVADYRANTPLFVSPATIGLPSWLVGDRGTYLTDPLGCPSDYTEAAFRYLEDVGGLDLRPSTRHISLTQQTLTD